MKKNKNFNPNGCPVTHCLNFIGGKWKPVILHLVTKGCNRFGQLQRAIPAISKQMLVNQLRELEKDNILIREVFAEVPPRVEYYMSDYGKGLLPIIAVMQEWGLKDMGKTSTA